MSNKCTAVSLVLVVLTIQMNTWATINFNTCCIARVWNRFIGNSESSGFSRGNGSINNTDQNDSSIAPGYAGENRNMKVPHLVIALACLVGNTVFAQVASGQLPPRLAKFSRGAIGYSRCANGNGKVAQKSLSCASEHVCSGDCCAPSGATWPDLRRIGDKLLNMRLPCTSSKSCGSKGSTGPKTRRLTGCKASQPLLNRDCIVVRLGRKLSELRVGCGNRCKSNHVADCCHSKSRQPHELHPLQPRPAIPPSPQPLPRRTTPRDPVPANPFLDDPPVQTRRRLSDAGIRIVRANPLSRQTVVLRIDDE